MVLVHYSQTRSVCPLLPEHQLPLLSGNPEEVVLQIQERYPNAHLFLIDLDDDKEQSSDFSLLPDLSESEDTVDEEAIEELTPHAGLRVLKLLRLKSYLQHCILYSRRSREEWLAEDPRHSILAAPGSTFIHLSDSLPFIEYERLHRQLAPRDMSAYFIAEIRDIEDSNAFANSWGVWKLWEVQRAVENITSQKTEVIERSFGDAYRQMNTYSGLLARYLHGSPYEDINKSLNEKLVLYGELLKQEAEVSKQHQAETLAIETLRTSLEQWGSLRDTNPAVLEATQQTLAALEKSVERSSAILAKCQAIKVEKNSISARKYSMNMRLSKELNRSSDHTFAEMRKRLNSKKPRIVFVDDLAYEGWAQILQRIIYNKEESSEFHVIVPESDIDYKALAQQIQNKVREVEADLLILDLRLRGEYGLASTLENASGMQVLSELSEQLPCPILVATTAEKMVNYRELLSWGATASWTKQGLKARHDNEYTVSNYVALVQAIHTLCFNETIAFCYQEFLPAIQSLEEAYRNQERLWWEERDSWGTLVGYEHIFPRMSEVLNILNTAYGHMRELIGSTIVSGTMDELSESDNSLIVTGLFQAIEHLYNIKAIEPLGEDYMNMYKRIAGLTPQISNNKFSNTILIPRNNAIHTGRIGSKELEKFIIALFDFLEGIGYFATEVSNSEYYVSRVSYIQENGYGNQDLIHLQNEELKLEGGRDRITLLSGVVEAAGYYMEDIVEGTLIRHTIQIDRNARGVISYYAQNVELI